MLQRILYFFIFTALGIFCAEVISSNIPNALFLSPLYFIYGLLYIQFIDFSTRRQVGSFANWYLWGVLLGLITETYVAKVMIFGLANEHFFIQGIPMFTLFFLGFFYHAFYSFLLPVYIGKRFLGMPFPIKESRFADIAVFLAPFIILPSDVVSKGGMPNFIPPAMLSCAALLMLATCMKLMGRKGNILLSHKERLVYLGITAVAYFIFLTKMTNTHEHGHVGALAFPMRPMLLLTVLIFSLMFLNIVAINKQGLKATTAIFDPADIKILKLFLFIVSYLISLVLPFILFRPLIPILARLLPFLGMSSALFGFFIFVRSVYIVMKQRFLRV